MFILIILFNFLLTLIFLLAGAFKLIRNKEQIIAGGGKWAEDFDTTKIKLIGAVEIMLAVLLALNFYVLAKPMISVFTASMMAIIMLGASVVHIRRKEYMLLAVSSLLMIQALFIVWLNV